MLMYNRQTSVSTQPGGRPTIVFSGDVSSTRQHSIRVTPLKKKKMFSSDVLTYPHVNEDHTVLPATHTLNPQLE